MRKMTIIIAALGALALPVATATATPADGKQVASSACKAQHKEMGNKAFKDLYGKHAMKSCRGAAVQTAANASQDCRTERATLGQAAFDELYGTNKNLRNSMGKCVSAKVRDSIDPDCGTVDTDDSGDDAGDNPAAARVKPDHADDDTGAVDDDETADDEDDDAADDDGCEVPDDEGDDEADDVD